MTYVRNDPLVRLLLGGAASFVGNSGRSGALLRFEPGALLCFSSSPPLCGDPVGQYALVREMNPSFTDRARDHRDVGTVACCGSQRTCAYRPNTGGRAGRAFGTPPSSARSHVTRRYVARFASKLGRQFRRLGETERSPRPP